MRREFVLGAALLVSLPVVWILGGCLKGSTAGAERAKVVSPEMAQASEDAAISQTEDKFAGVTITKLVNNRLPDVSGSVFHEMFFDTTCIADACYVVVRLAGLSGATNKLDRLHLIIDGRQFTDLVGRQAIEISGHTVRGDLVVPLDADIISALKEAGVVEYRLEATRVVEEAVGSSATGNRFEGKLSGENVLNVREMLALAASGG